MKYFILLLSFVACTFQNNNSTLIVALDKDPPSLDWQKTTDTTSRTIVLNIMEPLIDYKFTKNGFELQPALVKEWKPTKKGWHIRIEKNIMWSDGKAFTTQHIYNAFERLLNPKTAAFNAYLYYDIDNAKEYNTSKIKDFSKVGITIEDEHNLHFRLKNRSSYFPQLLALMSVMPIRKDLIKKHGKDWLSAKHFVGLGPYLLKERIFQEKVILKENPSYYRDPAKIKEIEFKIIDEAATAINLFESGALHALNQVPENQKEKLKSKDNYHEVKDYSIEYLAFNVKEKPFDKSEFRKALAHSINKKEIVTLLKGGIKENRHILPLGIYGYDSELGLNFNIEKAKALLDKKNDTSLELHFYSDEKQKKLAEYLQQSFKKNLNLKFELQQSEWKVYLDKVNSYPPPFYRIGWIAIYPDPSLFLGLFTSESHFNTSGWSNKKYDHLVDKIKALENGPQRKQAIRGASKILLEEEVVVIPLYTGARQYYIDENLKNYPLNGMNRLRYHKAYWDN